MESRGNSMMDWRMLFFSPNSQHIAYIAGRGGKMLLVVDEKPGPVYDGIGHGTVCYSPDGQHVAFNTKQGAKQAMVVDGKPGAAYDLIAGTPVFSPDSQHLAYAVKQDGNWFVVADGKPAPNLRWDR